MISTTRLKALEAVAQAAREYRAALNVYRVTLPFDENGTFDDRAAAEERKAWQAVEDTEDRLFAALDALDTLSKKEKQIEEDSDALFGPKEDTYAKE